MSDNMMGGYTGKILRVHLTTKRIDKEDLQPLMVRKYLGGRGLGVRILYDELKPQMDPFDPQNKLIIATAPLNGTNAPGFVKYTVVTKSPLSNTILMTLAGGFFATELKSAGYDAIIIEGKSEKPIYLLIRDENVEIRDAAFMWGMNTDDTEYYLKQILGDTIRVAKIGPAGEKLVRFAAIISDKRAFGRGGAGAVMGSKNLKAIAVSGSKEVGIANKDGFEEEIRKAIRNLKEIELVSAFGKYGTPMMITQMNEMGIFPTRNFQAGVFSGTPSICGDAVQSLTVRNTACYRCPVACGNLTLVREGEYAGALTEGPEYETVWSFGPQCGNSCLEAIVYLDSLCDKYGLDTISTGNVIGFAMELYERGILNNGDTEGIELKFGNHRAMVEMVKKIAFRQGLGNILAEGVMRAAEEIGKGASKYAMHTKGLELAGYDVRGAKGHGLGYATATRGGCHERSFAGQEIFDLPGIDRFAIAGKGAMIKENQDMIAAMDSIGMCIFIFNLGGISAESAAALYSLATGIETDVKTLALIGERIWNLERAFNNREGFTRKDDTLPARLLKEPLPEGKSKGQIVELEPMLDEYYKLRGWTQEGQIDSPKLKELELKL